MKRSATPKTPSRPRAKSAELLLEIGTEELPYQFIQPTLSLLGESAERLLKEHRLPFGWIRTLGTPRRLTLAVGELAERQDAATSEVMGPPKGAAFDAVGQPTRAATGFAAAQQVRVEDLQVRPTPKGEYVFAVKREAGRATRLVLADLLPVLLRSLSFPKSMHWSAERIRFARPVRWLLAVYGGRTVPVSFAGVTAGDRTYGHRVLGVKGKGASSLRITSFEDYMKVLERHGVVADPDQRRAMIVSQLSELARTARGALAEDEELLDQAVYTVEWPHAILGAFDPQYLDVPKEVLMTAMKEHQGFFALARKDGSLLPAFISVTNMKIKDMGLIRAGNERVLAARLADAKFFYGEDRRVRLEDRIERLAGVTFHQKLGTLRQKAERLAALARFLAEAAGEPGLAETVSQAAGLCKADLLTGLVGEFPTLQGIMGAEYARHDGESEAVCQAIRDHYLPKAMEGELPESLAGKLVSLADRLDSIVAFFHVGIVPTGSEDPLALRRQASAIVRLIVEGGVTLNLADGVRRAQELVASQGFGASGSASPQEFIGDRLRYYARSVRRVREDLVEAVLRPALRESAQRFDLHDLLVRMEALHAIASRPDFDPLMVGFKRAHRIVEKEQWATTHVDPSVFQHRAEGDLHQAFVRASEQVGPLIDAREYGEALRALVAMKPAIDAFFVGVMVNAEDQTLRANRLSLLSAIDRLFLSVADFSSIAVPGA